MLVSIGTDGTLDILTTPSVECSAHAFITEQNAGKRLIADTGPLADIIYIEAV